MIAVKHCVPMLMLVLCGCSLVHPHPSKELYVLPSPELERVPSAQPIVIKIGRARVAPPFDSRMFQYRIGEAMYEPAYYAQWAGDPGLLLADSISRSISSTGAFVVLDEASGADAPFLQLQVTDLYADARVQGSPGVVVAIRATVLNRHGEVLIVREIRRELPSASEQPADIVAAWAVGVGDAVRDLIPQLLATLESGDRDLPPRSSPVTE